MKKAVFVSVLLFCSVAASLASDEKENVKFAVGYSQLTVANNTEDTSVSQAAARVWFNDTYGADFTLGFQNNNVNGQSNNVFVLGGKMLGKVISLKSLDVYWLAGLNFGSASVAGESSSLFRISGGAGVEYYILPRLSLLTEIEIAYLSQKDNDRFGIVAGWVPQAGIRLYF